MKTIAFLALLLCISGSLFAEEGPIGAPSENRSSFTLSKLVQYALAHNPGVKQAEKNVDIEQYGVRAAKAERFPQVNLAGGATRYRYATPVTPISGSPLAGVPFPEFSETIYDLGAYLVLPLYKGGRLINNVRLSELRHSASLDLLGAARRDPIFNVTSLYYKILQLGRLNLSREAEANQLEAHRNQAETFFKAGKVARVEFLKSDVELAKAKENLLLAENSLMKTAYEVLRKVIGMEDAKEELTISEIQSPQKTNYTFDKAIEAALKKRPEYQASVKKVQAAEKRVDMAKGRRLPYVYIAGQYVEDASSRLDPKENWMAGLRMDVSRKVYLVAQSQHTRSNETLSLVREGPRKEDIESARMREQQAKAALAASQDRLKDSFLYAPSDGVVLKKTAELGEAVAGGVPVYKIGDLANPWVKVYVKENRLGLVRLGQSAKVTTDSYPGKVYNGTITYIASEAEFTPKTVQTEEERVKLVFGVKGSVQNPAGELKPGMPADVRVPLR